MCNLDTNGGENENDMDLYVKTQLAYVDCDAKRSSAIRSSFDVRIDSQCIHRRRCIQIVL